MKCISIEHAFRSAVAPVAHTDMQHGHTHGSSSSVVYGGIVSGYVGDGPANQITDIMAHLLTLENGMVWGLCVNVCECV